MSSIQVIPGTDSNIYVCVDCGAYADSPEGVRHFATCQLGESEKWRRFYDDEDSGEIVEPCVKLDDGKVYTLRPGNANEERD